MINLKVPYAEKDEAKALGARWNAQRKIWYVPDGVAPAPFERWITAGAAPAEASRDAFGAKVVAGAHYVELEHDCLPFAPCPQCQAALQESGWLAAYAKVRATLDGLGKA